ncbi:MAG: protein-arginine deiminase family protein [Pseudomonadota bacterium]
MKRLNYILFIITWLLINVIFADDVLLNSKNCFKNINVSNLNAIDKKYLKNCPKAKGFSPLGSYHLPIGIFVGIWCPVNAIRNEGLFSHKQFVEDLYYILKKNKLSIPLNVFIEDRCYNKISKYLSRAQDFNIFEVDINVENWLQDAFQVGIMQDKGLAILDLPDEDNEELSSYVFQSCKEATFIKQPVKTKKLLEKNNEFFSHMNFAAEGGGNIEAFPGGLLVVGDNMDIELKDYLRDQGNSLIEVKISFLEVGHVDEIFAVVPRAEASNCDFHIISASPKLAIEILSKENKKTRLPGAYDKVDTLLKDKELLNKNNEFELIINYNLSLLKKALELRTSCKIKDQSHLKFPVLWTESGTNEILFPNSVNSLILGNLMIIPNTRFEPFNKYISKVLKKNGIKYEFINDFVYSHLGGGVHCATNAMRFCN